MYSNLIKKMYICFFFSLSFEKYNKLDIDLYLLFHYSNYTLKKTFSIMKIVIRVIKKKRAFIFLPLITAKISLKKYRS